MNIISFAWCLQLHDGVKKAGIMGFCDPCPGEPKQLLVEYTFGGYNYEVLLPFPHVIYFVSPPLFLFVSYKVVGFTQVVVDDYAKLIIPHEGHRI